MATFHPNEIRVFSRAGKPLGVLTKWAVTRPRSYRLNEIETMAFAIPRKDTDGLILTNTVMSLLKRDNLVYIANEAFGMRGWAGEISSVTFGNDRATVEVNGGVGLLLNLEAELIEQTEGQVWTIAERLLAAANAKKAAHGDLVMLFAVDGSRANRGKFSYQGDVLAGLQQLAEETASEFYVHSRIAPDRTLRMTLHWGARYVIDHRSVWLRDGVGGSLLPGSEVTFSTTDIYNRIRLRGAPTDVGSLVEYDCVRSLVKEITPEITLSLEDPNYPNLRRRELLDLTVSFGYSQEVQRSLARTLQDKYLKYYRMFLYAYHTVRGRPYLDGYDWSGPDGNNDKKLTERFYRTYQKLGYIGSRTVITGSAGSIDDDDDGVDLPDAKLETWAYKQTIAIPANAVGIAMNYSDAGQMLIASSDGKVYDLASDRTTVTVWQNVTSTGETLKGIATDPAQPATIWTLHSSGLEARIKAWDYNTGTKLLQYVIAGQHMINDISVNVSEGELYCVANDGVGKVQVRDINNGEEVTGAGGSFDSGFGWPVGCSFNGGIVYVISSSGRVRMLFASDGNFAATFESGVAANGIMADASIGEIWVIQTNGDIRVYKAAIAIDTTPEPDVVNGYPGFDRIIAGQFVHIVAVGDNAFAGKNSKCVVVYSPGKYETEVVTSAIGEPDRFERTWVTGDQRVAFLDFSKVRTTVSEQVIQGEESRVCDWNPRQDGTGEWRNRWFKTAKGTIHQGYTNWWPKEWNVPDSDFLMKAPVWNEGKAFLQEYLAKNNKERTMQTLQVANVNNVWRRIVLGGLYTVKLSYQGGQTGLSGTLRVLAYEPDELNGIMTISGEWI